MKIHQATKVVSALIDNGKTFDGEDPHDIVKYLNACEDDGDCEDNIAKLFEYLSYEQRVAVLGALVDCDSNAGPLLTAMMEHGSYGEKVVTEAIMDLDTDVMCTLLKSLPPSQRIELYEQLDPKNVVEVLSSGVEDESTHEQRVAVLAALLDCHVFFECDSNAETLLTAMMEHWSDGEKVVAEAIQDLDTYGKMYWLLQSLLPSQRIQLYGQMDPENVAKVLSAGVENDSTRVNKKPRHW